MNTSSKELSEQLYKVLGWEGAELDWWRYDKGLQKFVLDIELISGSTAPAYTCGYLLRKLPSHYKIGNTRYSSTVLPTLNIDRKKGWNALLLAILIDGTYEQLYINHADTPEDALCKLAIELFRLGILKREE